MLAKAIDSIACMDKYARNFAQALEKSGMKDADLARSLGIKPANIYHWKTGVRPIPADKASQVADLVGVDAIEISAAFERVVQSQSLIEELENFESKRMKNKESQAQRFDPEMLALTHRALREMYRDELNRPYCLEDDPARFLKVYEFQASLSRSLPTADLIKVIKTAWLEQIKGALDNGRAGEGTDRLSIKGVHKGNMAGRVQRKKG